MAKVICPNCGGENNITKTSGQECQYCGSSLTDTKGKKQNAKDVKSVKEDNLYYVGKTKITPSEITEKAKQFIKKKLEKVGSQSKYWEIIQPIDETINLFSIETKMIYAPVYIYTGLGKSRSGELLNYCFSIESGGDIKGEPSSNISLSMAINYKQISFSKYLKMSREHKKGGTKTLLTDFPYDPNKLWNSVRGRDMRNNLTDWDEPQIYKTLIPLFVVSVNIGEHKYYIIYDWTGDEMNSDIYAPEYDIAKTKLGNDYMAIINKQWEDKQSQKQQLKEFEKQRILKKQKKEDMKTYYIIICLLIIIASGLYGYIYAIPQKQSELRYEQVSQEYERKRNEAMEKFEAYNPEKTFIKEFKGKWLEGNDYNKNLRFKIINDTELQYQTYEHEPRSRDDFNWGPSKTVPFNISLMIKDGNYISE